MRCFQSLNNETKNSNEFIEYCKEHGIERHRTIRLTPLQNGIARD